MSTSGTNRRLLDADSAALELSMLDGSWTRELDRERRAMADLLAVERRRIAADVHDLIMQDLALALANARTLADDGVRHPLGEHRRRGGGARPRGRTPDRRGPGRPGPRTRYRGSRGERAHGRCGACP